MVTIAAASALALAYEATEEAPHFENTAFKVKGKIFMTLNPQRLHVTVRLSLPDQSMFAEYYPGVVYPVPNAWGKQGWTHVDLRQVAEELLSAIIRISYCMTAPKKLAAKYQDE